MTDVLIVFCTCVDEAEAERIAKSLVEERLAACVNLLPGVRSTYRWQGAIEQAKEVLLIIKTIAQRWDALKRRLAELHSYDVPEMLAVPVVEGSDKYVSWLREQL